MNWARLYPLVFACNAHKVYIEKLKAGQVASVFILFILLFLKLFKNNIYLKKSKQESPIPITKFFCFILDWSGSLGLVGPDAAYFLIDSFNSGVCRHTLVNLINLWLKRKFLTLFVIVVINNRSLPLCSSLLFYYFLRSFSWF